MGDMEAELLHRLARWPDVVVNGWPLNQVQHVGAMHEISVVPDDACVHWPSLFRFPLPA